MSICKGNLVVGQSGGPTAVINNSLVGVIHEAMEHKEIEGIYGMVHGIQGLLHEELMDLRQEAPSTLNALRDTPSSALGTVRYKVKDTDYERLLEVFIAYNVRYFFYIGGNDSMDTTNKISQLANAKNYELHAIGVPKTVDNDLVETDHCPGFGSAARFVATAIRDTGYDTLSMGDSSPIKFMEIMGRNAGWLTASSVLAQETPDDPPHLIYLPERGVSVDQIVTDVEAVYKRLSYCVVAVSEGAKDELGNDLGSGPGDVDAFGHKLKGGVVEFLSQTVKDRLKLRTRYDKPGYLQRSFASQQSSVDREEAYQVGRRAVRAAIDGFTGQMVTILRTSGVEYLATYGMSPLDQIANREHCVPSEYINAQGNGVTDGYIRYARPLIGGPLIHYARLAKYLVARRSR
jgi:ATP-dependent phosphofructokinase / diphosphate-dependent phosphofructokinase